MRCEELRGRRVVIWGAGREGRAALLALREAGIPAEVVVTGGGDASSDLPVLTGSQAWETLAGADVVVKSPGIARTDPDYQRLVDAGVEITSLTALWLRENHGRVIAVTGTKGKSTTSTVTRHVLEAVGISARLVGNVGTPVTVDDTEASVAVAEISSYQAADVDTSPAVAVVTSLYPEHLPWHGGYEEYVHDKLNLLAHDAGAVVIPDDRPELRESVVRRAGDGVRIVTPSQLGIIVTDDAIAWEGVGVLDRSAIDLPGEHNLVNITLALAAATVYASSSDADMRRMLSSLAQLSPLAYRLERIPSADDRLWIDDSLATAPESVVAALETFWEHRILLIAGGADRGVSFAPLVEHLRVQPDPTRISLILVGPAGRRLHADLADAGLESTVAPDFRTAVGWARADNADSDLVLLSPASPSFDEFDSYESRSAAFRAGALDLPH